MLKPENDEIAAAINRLLAACTSLGYGEMIPYELMEDAFGVKKDAETPLSWNYLRCKFKQQFRKVRGMVLWCVPNVGYHICTQAEQGLENPNRRLRKSRRHINRGLRETECGNYDDLSDHERSVLAFTIKAMRNAKNEIASNLREQEAGIRKSDAWPVRMN